MRHAMPAARSSMLDDAGQEPAHRVVRRLLRGRDEHLVDRGLRAERLAGARAGAAWRATGCGPQWSARNAFPTASALRSSTVVTSHHLLEAAVEEGDPLPEARRALVREDAHRDRPAAVDLAEDAVGRDHDVVEEDLRELVHAVEHLDRGDRDAGRVHVDEERGDAAVAVLAEARCASAGRSGRLYWARLVQTFWPLTTHATRVAASPVGHRRAAQRREVAPGVGLGEALAPELRPERSRGDDLGRERRRREVDQRRREDLDEREEARIRRDLGPPASRRARCAGSPSRRDRRRAPATRTASIPRANSRAVTRCIWAICSSSVPESARREAASSSACSSSQVPRAARNPAVGRPRGPSAPFRPPSG